MAVNIVKKTKFDGYQSRFSLIVCNLQIYIFYCAVTHKPTGINSDQVYENGSIVEELHKPIISKILIADLPDMQLISKYYEGFLSLLYAVNISSIHAFVV